MPGRYLGCVAGQVFCLVVYGVRLSVLADTKRPHRRKRISQIWLINVQESVNALF